MADSQLDVTIRGRDDLTPQLQNIESRLIRFVGFVASAVSAIKIGSFPITEAAALQRELANVAKTTQFTAPQIQQLTDQLAALSLTTDTSATDLAKIAAAAGQQGLGKEGVEGIRAFTESVARMASVLDLTAEESGAAMGKILNIFQLLPSQAEKVSSAINQVSNNSTAKAQELLNVLRRLGDAGGSLKFTESLALSGTAIDLGATPEVAGTTLSKFINAIKVRNEDFVKLLKKTNPDKFGGLDPDKLAEMVQEDSFGVFKEVMNSFGKLKLTDRQAAINKLFGGGRITALADKFMQDMATNTSVLNKNALNAAGGFNSGQSAINEQATVMATLVKQVDILKNSFSELGRQAGEDLLRPLSGYVAQLRMALQTPQFRAFADAVVASLGRLIEFIINTGQAIAGMNINWENFVKVLEVFVKVKFLQSIIGLVGQLPGMAAIMARITGTTTQAGAAAGAAGAAGERAARQQVTAYQALRAQLALLVRDYRAAATAASEQAAAELAASRRRAGEEARRASLAASQRNLNQSQVAVRQAERGLSATVVNTSAVRQQGGRDIQNAAAAGQAGVDQITAAARARQVAAETAHQQQMEAIRTKYVGARTAVLKAARDAEYAAEQAHYNRQIAALRAASTRQISNAEASAAALLATTTRRVAAEIAAEESRVVAQQRVLARMQVQARIAEQNAAQLARIAQNNAAGITPTTPNPNGAVSGVAGAAAAGAAGAAAGAAAAGAVNNGRLAAIGAAAAGLLNFSRIMGLVVTGVRAVLAMLGPLALGFTVLYTVLDALGVIEKLPGWFNKLTDAIGLSSEATRKAAQGEKDAREERQKQLKQLDDLIERYGKLKDISGQISAESIGKIEDQFKGATSTNDIKTGADQLALLLEGSLAEQRKVQSLVKTSPQKSQQAQSELAAAKKGYDEARIALAEYQKQAEKPTSFASMNVSAQLMGQRLKNEFEQQKALYDEAVSNAAAYGPAAASALQKSLPALESAVNQAKTILGGLMTDQTSEFFNKVAPQVLALKQEIEKMKAPANGDGTSPNANDPNQSKLALAIANRDKQTTDAAWKAAQTRVEIVQAEIAAKEAAVANTLRTLSEKLRQFAADKSISAAFTNAFATAVALIDSPAEKLAVLVDANKNRSTPNNAALVSPLINGRPAATTAFKVGGDNGKGSAESEARRLAKARAELEKAELVARFDLQKQFNDQFLAEEQRLYDNGLLALKDYYAGKKAIDEINLNNEIALKNAEIQTKQKELTTPEFKPSDRVRVQSEIVALEGQKKVLQAKLEEIPKAAQESVRKAVKEFNESTLSDKLDIMHSLGVSSFSEELQTGLDLATSQISIKLERFKTELKNGTPGIDQAFIDAFRLNGLVKAIEPVLQSIADKTNRTISAIENRVRSIQFSNDTGGLTDREAERALNQARSEQAEVVRQQIEEIEEVRKVSLEKISVQEGATQAEIEATTATLKASNAYQEQEVQLESLKQKYVELKTVVDETASSINRGIEGSLARAIKGFADGTGGGIKSILLNMGREINDTILNSITKDMSQSIMKALSSTGTGGIGGFFSSLFGGGKREGTPLVSKDLLGRNASNAMFVRMVGAGSDSPIENLIDVVAGGNEEQQDTKEAPDNGFLSGLLTAIKQKDESVLSGTFDFMRFDGKPSSTESTSTLLSAETLKLATTSLTKVVEPATKLLSTGSGLFQALTGNTNAPTLSKDLLGRNPLNAMYVRLVDQGSSSGEGGIGEALGALGEGREREPNVRSLPRDTAGNGDISLGGEGVGADEAVDAAANGVKSVFNAITDQVTTGIPIADQAIKGLGNSLIDGFSALGGDVGFSFMDMFSDIGSLVSDLGSGLTDAMADVMKVVGDMLSEMIAQMASSSSGSSGGEGDMISMIMSSFFHTGGVVGSGVPQRTAAFSPSVFHNAVRYHTGGIAGLQPDEVPSILKKGEEVLTTNDPRHRNNGGMETGGGSTIHAPVTIHVTTPDANSFRRSQDQVAARAGLALSRAITRNT